MKILHGDDTYKPISHILSPARSFVKHFTYSTFSLKSMEFVQAFSNCYPISVCLIGFLMILCCKISLYQALAKSTKFIDLISQAKCLFDQILVVLLTNVFCLDRNSGTRKIFNTFTALSNRALESKNITERARNG